MQWLLMGYVAIEKWLRVYVFEKDCIFEVMSGEKMVLNLPFHSDNVECIVKII